MANIITLTRIILSIALLFTAPLSWSFYALYLSAGLSDAVDGPIARKTNTVSELGSRLDTLADILFFAACFIQLFPLLSIPAWLWVWIGIIAAVKLTAIGVGLFRHKTLVAEHTLLNKLSGALLFILPLVLPLVDLKYIVLLICCTAALASVEELVKTLSE